MAIELVDERTNHGRLRTNGAAVGTRIDPREDAASRRHQESL
jgi:hypothetical protein